MNVWQIVLVILGNTGFFALIQTIIQNRNSKKGILSRILESVAELKKQMKKQEKDNCRTQLLLLMSAYPQDIHELMTVAEHYFQDLHGNWYMTTLFRGYLKKNNITPPVWLSEVAASNRKETG